MNPELLIDRLASGAPAIAALVEHIPAPAARMRPTAGRWSILEILCHLRDEEREDFRVRIDFTLHRAGAEWPEIDPPGWVSARGYAAEDPRRVLDDLLKERQESVQWLRSLDNPDWDLAYNHPQLGKLTAGDLLASWAAHDLLHIRQLAAALYALVGSAAGPYSTTYAGKW